MSLGDKMKMEFGLGAMVKYEPRPPIDGEERPDPHTLIETGVHENIVLTIMRLIEIERVTSADLVGVYVQTHKAQEGYGITLSFSFPEAYKEHFVQQQKGIYDRLGSFARRMVKDAPRPDAIVLYTDHVSRDIDIRADVPDVISMLARLVHTKYRGDQKALGHLYMANHLLDRLQFDERALCLN